MSKESIEQDAVRIAAINKVAAEIRVAPPELVRYAIISGKSADDAKTIFETFQKTGCYAENGSQWGEPIPQPAPSPKASKGKE